MEEVKFNFEDLRVYQKALHFVDTTYEITRKFPKEEKYGLISQYTRAAVSIALNIAEDSNPQFNRYLQIAQDSIKECVVCSTVAVRQKMITKTEDSEARITLSQLAKMLTNLQKYLKK
jgi:four helix bundle protein